MSTDTKIKIAAIQLEGVPKELYVNSSAKEINSSPDILNKIDANSIKKHNLKRILNNIKLAADRYVDLAIFPELSLSSFFPYFYTEEINQLDKFFEEEDFYDNVYLQAIYNTAVKHNIAVAFGYAEKTKEDERYNTFTLIDKSGKVFKYRKTHIPGFRKPIKGKHFQYELKYFAPSKLGYPVFDALIGKNTSIKNKVGMMVCHDRRYNAPYTAMGLKGAEIIINGFNTPFVLTQETSLDEFVYRFHYLPQQGQAISEGVYIVSVARAGEIFGVKQIAGTCIISPTGEILAKTEELSEQIIEQEIDLRINKTVKAQKYFNERANVNILYSELSEFKN